MSIVYEHSPELAVMAGEEIPFELKPCPFCGSGAYVIRQYVGSYEHMIFSVACEGAEIGCGYVFFACDTEKEAIAAWNRRAQA